MPGDSKPNLPEVIDWPEETVTWFNAWRDSPITETWGDVEWQYFYDTALVHASIWGSSNFAMLGELRGRLHAMGLTFEPPKQAPVQTKENTKPKEVTPLHVIQTKRSKKAARASGA